ncbi:MAG: hypothetical protein MJZ19_01225 [Paludibacteraceae bacterium]|nr:hypothetical protein [Paludibacteraceae bacterium]
MAVEWAMVLVQFILLLPLCRFLTVKSTKSLFSLLKAMSERTMSRYVFALLLLPLPDWGSCLKSMALLSGFALWNTDMARYIHTENSYMNFLYSLLSFSWSSGFSTFSGVASSPFESVTSARTSLPSLSISRTLGRMNTQSFRCGL